MNSCVKLEIFMLACFPKHTHTQWKQEIMKYSKYTATGRYRNIINLGVFKYHISTVWMG